MKKWILASLIVMLPVAGMAADNALQWAYPAPPPNLPPLDNTVQKAVPGTTTGLKLTQVQIDNAFGPPDWFPNDHAPMPQVVSHGRMPNVRACMLCHLANGNGHPESASVSGLTANYITEQMHEFRDGNRVNNRAPAMITIAKDITEDELKQAADYFSAIKPEQQNWIKVVESDTAPKNHVGPGGMRFHDADGGTMPIPVDMIYELPQSDDGAMDRDQRYGFTDYVPKGSIEKGEALATTGGGGKTIQCSVCHGAEFKGIGDVPRLAGRSAYYLIRQLKDIKTGGRKGTAVALMKPVVDKLSDEDIVDLAAYMASRKP
jgi:cytochrome c553